MSKCGYWQEKTVLSLIDGASVRGVCYKEQDAPIVDCDGDVKSCQTRCLSYKKLHNQLRNEIECLYGSLKTREDDLQEQIDKGFIGDVYYHASHSAQEEVGRVMKILEAIMLADDERSTS